MFRLDLIVERSSHPEYPEVARELLARAEALKEEAGAIGYGCWLIQQWCETELTTAMNDEPLVANLDGFWEAFYRYVGLDDLFAACMAVASEVSAWTGSVDDGPDWMPKEGQ